MKKLILSCVIASIAAYASADALYIVSDTSNHELYSIDPGTMAVTAIGSLGIDGSGFTFGDLAYDSANKTMYYSGGRGDENLYTVNLTTGAATLVGADGQPDMFALGYDNGTNSLYGASSTYGYFGSVSMVNGSFSPIGNTGIYNEGLTYNTATGQLILTDPQEAYSVDPTTGVATALAGTGFQNDNGITYDSATNQYWMFNYFGNLVQFNAGFGVLSNTNLGVGDGSSIAYVAGVPEPMSFAVLGIGVVALLRRRSRK